MKQTIRMVTLVFILITVTFLRLQAQEDNECLIARKTDGSISLLSSEVSWDATRPVESYTLSPSYTHLAVQFDSASPEAKIGIYSITESGLQEQVILENTRIIRGLGWSDDGNKLLVQSSHSSHLIYMYDLLANQLISLTDDLLPTLQIHQAAWIPNSDGILFVATENPFPTTEFGRNGVVALYHLDLSTLHVSPISKPDENVDWYFGNFVALANSRIVYSSCSIGENELCNLNIVSSDEIISMEGVYRVSEAVSDDNVLVYRSHQINETSLEFELLVLNTLDGTLTSILTIPSIFDFPAPIMSLSPDKSKLSYMMNESSIAIFDIQQVTNRLIASVDSPTSGKWHPNSDELLYWTSNSVYVYKYGLDETLLIQNIVQESETAEFMWFCITQ